MTFLRGILLALLVTMAGSFTRAEPPFWGTIFIDPDIVVPADPSAYESLTDAGRGTRTMFDRRVNDWVSRNAYLFTARFDDGLQIEVQVNPEFGSTEAARAEALRFMHAVGQLPTALRVDVQTMWIHKGLQPFGGGNNNLLIHSEQADAYIQDGILEETLMHEASHTSLDSRHATAPGWIAAQNADPEFISVYARDNPTREDVAETFVPYFAVQYRRDRIDAAVAEQILEAIPNRIAYLNAQSLNLYPADQLPISLSAAFDREDGSLTLRWHAVAGRSYSVLRSTDLKEWQTIATGLSSAEGEGMHRIEKRRLFSPQYFKVRQD